MLYITDGNSAGSVIDGFGVNLSLKTHREVSQGGPLCNGDSICGRDPILPDRINTNTENPHASHPPVSLFGFSLALPECGNLYQLNNRCTQKKEKKILYEKGPHHHQQLKPKGKDRN